MHDSHHGSPPGDSCLELPRMLDAWMQGMEATQPPPGTESLQVPW